MVKYKAVMDASVAGKFVERFATTIVSTISKLSLAVNSGRVSITLEATTYLGEEILSDALSATGEFAQWGYDSRFRVPVEVALAGSKV